MQYINAKHNQPKSNHNTHASVSTPKRPSKPPQPPRSRRRSDLNRHTPTKRANWVLAAHNADICLPGDRSIAGQIAGQLGDEREVGGGSVGDALFAGDLGGDVDGEPGVCGGVAVDHAGVWACSVLEGGVSGGV
jgi:hypothetical protein